MIFVEAPAEPCFPQAWVEQQAARPRQSTERYRLCSGAHTVRRSRLQSLRTPPGASLNRFSQLRSR